jgi:hypothetical protein
MINRHSAFCKFLVLAAVVSSGANAQTLEERARWVETQRDKINDGAAISRKSFFSFAYYSDKEKIFYMEVGGANVPQDSKYIKRYDIQSGSSTIFVPIPWHGSASIRSIQYDRPIQRALFNEGKQLSLIEMDFEKETWKTILFLPEGLEPNWCEEIPNSNLLSFTYPLDGFEHNNPDLFGLDILDYKTGERKTILEKIHHKNSSVSSQMNHLPYVFLNKTTLLYVETIDPGPSKKTDDRNDLFDIARMRGTYDILWRLNFVSGEKIQWVTSELKLSSHFLNRNGHVLWNETDLGLTEEILQRTK